MCVVWVGMVVTRVGCDVCPCDPCDRVCPVCPLCVPAPPGIFLPVPVLFCTGVSRLPRCLSLPVPVLFCTGTFTGVSRLPPVSLNRYRYCTGCVSRLPPVSLNLVPNSYLSPQCVESAAVSADALTCGLCVRGFGWL